VPRTLILGSRSPVSLPEFQMITMLKFTTSSGPKKKKPRHACQKHPSKSPVREPPPCYPTGSRWREMLRLQIQWSIHSFISIGVPKKKPSHKIRGKHTVTVHGALRGWKAYIQWCATWFPMGIINSTAVSTPVSCSLQHDTFHLGLGRPEPR
jgi:hypothetical protein